MRILKSKTTSSTYMILILISDGGQTCQQTLGIQRQHSLDGNEGPVEAVMLEHLLDHLLSVLVWVHRRLRQHDQTLLGVEVHLFLAEGVVPDVSHVLPGHHLPILHGVVDLQVGPVLAASLANLDISQLILLELGGRPDDGPTHLRFSDNQKSSFQNNKLRSHHAREDMSREVGPRIATLDKARPVVANNNRLPVSVHVFPVQ